MSNKRAKSNAYFWMSLPSEDIHKDALASCASKRGHQQIEACRAPHSCKGQQCRPSECQVIWLNKNCFEETQCFFELKLNMAFNLNLSHDLTTQNSVFHTQQIRIPTTPPIKPSQLYIEKQEVHGFDMSKYRVSWGNFDTSRTWKQSIVSSFSRFLF